MIRTRVPLAAAALCAGLTCGPALAHVPGAGEGGSGSVNELAVYLLILLSAGWYAAGLLRLWRAAGVGHGARPAQILAFAAGLIILAVGLSPLVDAASEASFAAHMVEHTVLVLVAAPLLVLGRPLPVFLWAFPRRHRQTLADVGRVPWLAALWHAGTRPLTAWFLHGAALWVWHAPVLFDAAVSSEWVHFLQHLSFLVTSLFFWWSVFFVRGRAVGSGAAVLSLFTTVVHTGVLGALLTLAPRALYTVYAENGPWGLSPLEDQQLAGLVMWIPAGLVYTGLGLLLILHWLRQSELRVQRRQRVAA